MKLSHTNMPDLPETHRRSLVLFAESRLDAKLLGVLERLILCGVDVRDGVSMLIDCVGTSHDKENE